MKKIIIDARGIQYSTGRYACMLLRHLETIDPSNQYLVIINPEDDALWTPTKQNFKKIITKYKHGTIAEQFGFLWQLYRLKADLVHFTMPQQPVLYFKTKITTVHDLTLTKFNGKKRSPFISNCKRIVFSFFLKAIVRNSEKIICPSNTVKQELIGFLPSCATKCAVIYEAADFTNITAKPLTAINNKNYVLYVGTAFPHKNIKTLLDAFSLVSQQCQNTYLVLAGRIEFYYQKMIRYAKCIGLKNAIFTDFISDNELKWLYKNAKLFIFPSLSEGFGLPGLEAMQHNLAVAASHTSCLPEIYGDAALYFNPNDSHQMADAIIQLLNDQRLRTSLADKGKTQLNKYSWLRTAQQTHRLYQQALQT